MPGTVLGPGDTAENKADKILSSRGIYLIVRGNIKSNGHRSA